MIFSAPEFIFVFLPIAFAGFFLFGAIRPFWAVLWLLGASLAFYGSWRIDFVPLLLGSMLFNFYLAKLIVRASSLPLLVFGIVANLGALIWFKYAGFLAETINLLTDAGVPIPEVVLPLAISFFTFQQIAYLVDVHAGGRREESVFRYMLFVTFFPHLIAGPIVHHKEILDQFRLPETYHPHVRNILLGVTAFTIGLFKKVVIADPLGGVATMAYGPAATGIAPAFVDSWLGAIAFSLQLYFDFSGYSDMAIGLALLFGIRLPVNFVSPYKAASIIDFWARWHLTLTRFLTSYVYNPLVMTITRRRIAAGKPLLKRSAPALGPFVTLLAFPTLFTMFLAGIWHGAGWQFLIFGLFHGALLVINHAWRALRQRWGIELNLGATGHAFCVLLTFLLVTTSFVFFKSGNMDQALTLLRGMAGFGGDMPVMSRIGGADAAEMGVIDMALWRLGSTQGALIILGLAIAWLLPNTARYMEMMAGALEARPEKPPRPTPAQPLIFRMQPLAVLRPRASFLEGGVLGALLALALLRVMSVAPSEFLYFTF